MPAKDFSITVNRKNGAHGQSVRLLSTFSVKRRVTYGQYEKDRNENEFVDGCYP